MQIIKTGDSVEKCRSDINLCFGKKLPKKYMWSRLKTKQYQIWYLTLLPVKIVAKVIGTDDDKFRFIHLDEKIFDVEKEKKKKKKIKRAKNPSPRHKSKRQFPPPFKPSPELMDKLIEKYHIHDELEENPDPADCPSCGMKYKDLKTGFTFRTVQDMLFVDSNDPTYWRYKGRHSVLGLWYEIKRSMWQDHLQMCEKPDEQKEWLADFEPEDFEY